MKAKVIDKLKNNYHPEIGTIVDILSDCDGGFWIKYTAEGMNVLKESSNGGLGYCSQYEIKLQENERACWMSAEYLEVQT